MEGVTDAMPEDSAVVAVAKISENETFPAELPTPPLTSAVLRFWFCAISEVSICASACNACVSKLAVATGAFVNAVCNSDEFSVN